MGKRKIENIGAEAFTLVELIVAVAVCAILLGLLLPALRDAKGEAEAGRLEEGRRAEGFPGRTAPAARERAGGQPSMPREGAAQKRPPAPPAGAQPDAPEPAARADDPKGGGATLGQAMASLAEICEEAMRTRKALLESNLEKTPQPQLWEEARKP